MRRRSVCNNRCLAILLGCFLCGVSFCAQLCAGDIVVYGDSQVNKDAQRKVVQAIAQLKPSVIFRVGDIVNDGNDPEEWKQFREIAYPLLHTAEYYPCLGNHEMDSSLYFNEFPRIHNQRWYALEHQDVHFIVLDSNSDLRPDSEQYKWLVSDLSNTSYKARFTIALFHHPLFDAGVNPEDEKGLRPILLPLFEKYGVSAVFSGHDHNYQRFLYQGTYFIVTGGGGADLMDMKGGSPYLKKFVKAYHFCELSPGEDSLNVKVIDADLQVIDEFNIPVKTK